MIGCQVSSELQVQDWLPQMMALAIRSDLFGREDKAYCSSFVNSIGDRFCIHSLRPRILANFSVDPGSFVLHGSNS